jgi:acetylornithine deacetylase/succinyl-diaminopimelate desuccinylase-like protein
VSAFIKTFGRAAHSSVPEKGENAIIRMARVIMAFADYNDRLLQSTPHPLCGHGRFNPGVIRGGVQVNTVPDWCELEIDRRTLPDLMRRIWAVQRPSVAPVPLLRPIVQMKSFQGKNS